MKVHSMALQQKNQVKNQIAMTCLKYDRLEQPVKLVAVSKGRSAEQIRAAYGLEQFCFAENYLQEALSKKALLTDLPIEWHYIGRIQRNKTRRIAEQFDWVQTVASEDIAARLNRQRPKSLAPLNICIQVNVCKESEKAGIELNQVANLIESILGYGRLSWRGFMTMITYEHDFEQQRVIYGRLAELFYNYKELYPQLDTLSMGVSHDFTAAIAAGATLIRVGQAIFNEV